MTDYTELVKALRIRSGNLCPGDICDRCEAIHFLCSDKVMHDAAAAIEALQATIELMKPYMPDFFPDAKAVKLPKMEVQDADI